MAAVGDKLVIIGAGGLGREVAAWARQSVQFGRIWDIKGFIDDEIEPALERAPTLPIFSRVIDYEPRAEDVFVCAIGTPEYKRACTEAMVSRGGRFTQLIHRTAIIGDNVVLDDGVIMCPFSVASANNRLGRGVVLGLHATVDHDAVVGRWSQINNHCDLTASVNVGASVFLGSSVSVLPGVRIGDAAYIGAGSVVTRDVPPGATAYGVPARVRK